jgi:hypothetical protein
MNIDICFSSQPQESTVTLNPSSLVNQKPTPLSLHIDRENTASCCHAKSKLDCSHFDAELDLTNVTSEGSHEIISNDVRTEHKGNKAEIAITIEDATHESALDTPQQDKEAHERETQEEDTEMEANFNIVNPEVIPLKDQINQKS